MSNDEIFKIISDSIDSIPKLNLGKGRNNWVSLARLELSLQEKGVDFKSFGFNELRDFLCSFKSKLEVQNSVPQDESVAVACVRKIEPNSKLFLISQLVSHKMREVILSRGEVELDTKISVSKIKNSNCALFNWAYLRQFDDILEKLSGIALDEKWEFSSSINGKSYPILRNYLIYTFERIQVENKIVISDNTNFAVFNTGLVNKLYSPIYALFRKNTIPGKQIWAFYDFAVEGEGRIGKILVAQFRELPQSPKYFTNIADVYYDLNMGAPKLDIIHILIERAERIPIQLLKAFGPANFEFRDYQTLPNNEKSNYAESLSKVLLSDVDAQRRIQSRFDSAVRLAMKRVRWNYKSVIPMYYPKKQEMHLLLPLCLVDDQIVDTALVVSKEPSGHYQGQTIYPLDWAYKYARLVCRPDSDWLTVDTITTLCEDFD